MLPRHVIIVAVGSRFLSCPLGVMIVCLGMSFILSPSIINGWFSVSKMENAKKVNAPPSEDV
jgi:hypothetical protein